MPALSDLRTRIRRYLKETNASTSFWNQNFLDQLINAAYRRRCSQLISAHEGWFVSVATRDLEADKDRYAFPDGFQRLQKLEIVRSDGSTQPVLRRERHYNINPSDSGEGDLYLPTYRPISNGFVLEPTPTTTVSGGLRIEYAGLPVQLSAAGDSLHPAFPEIFDELIVLDTVVAAFDSEGVHEIGAIRSILRLRAEFEFDWNRFIDNRTVSTNQITPFVGPYLDA